MMDGSSVRVILAPYDAGHRGIRMGSGPEHLLDNRLEEELRSNGREVKTVMVRPDGIPPFEVAVAFELDRLVSEEVRQAAEVGEFPLVLSGNCNTAVGTISGAGAEGLGVVGFDAHADFETPETTTTGFTDNMGLAITVGHCWNAMAASVPGFQPMPEANVLLVGTRDASQAERARLEGSEITVVGGALVRRKGLSETLGFALDTLRARVERIYVHLDLDVLDPGAVGPANEFAVPGGLVREDLEQAITMIRERFDVAAAGIASYDPTFDDEGEVLRAGLVGAKTLTAPCSPSR
ncbi:MAG: arginase family protein [Rubrobacteraceae bacterium]